MRKIIGLLFVCIFSFSAILSAKIVEVEHFNEIIQYAVPETLVLLDIDDTLLIPKQALGTDVWFVHRLKEHEAKESSFDNALDKALAEWEAVRHVTGVKPVEEGSDKIIDEMQKKQIVVMGLTTQGLALATRTVKQLHSLNIDLSLTAPSEKDFYFSAGQGVLYRDGVLFTSGTPKGPALLKFLDDIRYRPKQIVFINDKETHLRDVEQSVLARGIAFIGLRYNYSDGRVANFRKEIADIQWNHSTFGRILSDEEANELLHSQLIFKL